MIYAILNRLKNDTQLSSLLSSTENDSKIYPLFTIGKDCCITYNDSPVSGGDVKENRLELRIIDNDYDHMMQIEERLNALLDLKEYEQGFIYGNVSVMTSSLNGGGTLENDVTESIERILFYNIKWRKKEV